MATSYAARLASPVPAPPSDVATLPECLDGMPVVMRAHERDCSGCGNTIEDGHAGKGGAGAPATACAGNLHPLSRRALPSLRQRGQDVGPIGRQTEIWPAKPP